MKRENGFMLFVVDNILLADTGDFLSFIVLKLNFFVGVQKACNQGLRGTGQSLSPGLNHGAEDVGLVEISIQNILKLRIGKVALFQKSGFSVGGNDAADADDQTVAGKAKLRSYPSVTLFS